MALLNPPTPVTEQRGAAPVDARSLVEQWLQQLESKDAALRNAAITALHKRPEPLDHQLVLLLNDPQVSARLRAVDILATLRHPLAAEWLTTVIKRDADAKVCIAAIDLLGEVGDHSTVAPLRAVKRRFAGNSALSFAADVAIGQIE